MKIWSKIQNQVAEKPQELIFGIVASLLVTIVVLLGLVVMIRTDFDQEATDQGVPINASPPEFRYINNRDSGAASRVGTLSADMAEKGSSGISGTLLFVEFADPKNQIFIGVELKGQLEKGTAYPAFITEGSCDQPGSQLYSLSPITDGKTENYLRSSLVDFKKQLPLALVVLKSAQEPHIIIACGDLLNT